MRNNTYLFITTSNALISSRFRPRVTSQSDAFAQHTDARCTQAHINGRSNCEQINTSQCVCYCNNVRGSILLGAL